jgi:purine nucleoside phosphorylase
MAPNSCYLGVAGPRFETSAEVRMFGMLGGDVIGYTGTTECVPAREAGLCYATIAGVIRLGADLSDRDMNAGLWHGSRRQHVARFRQISTQLTLSMKPGNDTTECRCAVAAPIEC